MSLREIGEGRRGWGWGEKLCVAKGAGMGMGDIGCL